MGKHPKDISEIKGGSVFAIPLSRDWISYICTLRDAVAIYPVVTKGGYLPLDVFNGSNWRWFVWLECRFPSNAIFAGMLPGEPGTFRDPVCYEHNVNTARG